jgi:hypothetical protein
VHGIVEVEPLRTKVSSRGARRSRGRVGATLRQVVMTGDVTDAVVLTYVLTCAPSKDLEASLVALWVRVA